ncbi:MAG: NAD(P)H-dependent oxidoreductase subunit E, partial [Deltaproteobacteria bacterium]|nr:NAD(P)H-dependent oxidoreductase subunit E [Deltaproteobacteria bacterium]
MTKLENREALEELRNSLKLAQKEDGKRLISLCAGSGCGAYGTAKVHKALMAELAEQGMQDDVEVKLSGCHGFCEKGPILVIHPEGIFYPQVKEEHVSQIVEETLKNGKLVKSLIFKDPLSKKKIFHEHDVPFYKLQQRIIFGNNGLIDPTSIEDYISVDGYSALEKALFDM